MPLPQEGLLSQGQPQPVAPTQQPVAPTQQPVAPTQQPVAPTQQQPGQPGRPMGNPQVDRDYSSNPINNDDKDALDQFTILATQVIHGPETRDKVLARIKGINHPYDEIAEASLVVIDRVEQSGPDNGQWDRAVKLMGGMNVVGQVIELASSAGKIPQEIPEDDKQIILGQTMQKYYQKKIASGEITKEQAANDAHIASTTQAKMKGADTTEVSQRAIATQGLQKQAANTAELATKPPMGGGGGGIQAPAPAANPMRPETTMKETLAGGAGGLLNG